MLTFGTVICTYQRKHLLEQSLQHWNQSRQYPDQLIIVDATEEAPNYYHEIIQKFPCLFAASDSQYIISDQPGLTYQRNLGLRALKTDIVTFADDDAFVSPDYVTKILEVFQADTQHLIGGINGVGTGQFNQFPQKHYRHFRNYLRHHLGWLFQRIHIPKNCTKLHDPLPTALHQFPLIHVDRLWGANMSYRTELIQQSGFDENFKRYGLFEDVELSVRVGTTHKLVCRLDAEITHDEELGKTTRPNDARYFLASWVNAAYIIEKLFPCEESRSAYQRFFKLTQLISRHAPQTFGEQRFRLLGNQELFNLANHYIEIIQACETRERLAQKFIELQSEIASLPIATP